MKGSEITLVFFTLFAQAAVGMLAAFGVVNYFTAARAGIENGRVINEKLLLVICALFIGAVIISFLHLGNFKNAFYAMNNLAGSWLSREILFVIIFGLFLTGFALVYFKDLFSLTGQAVMVSASVIAGLSLIFVMARIYMIEIIPAWNNMATPILFYLSSFILGGLTFAAAYIFLANREGVHFSSLSGMHLIIRMIIGAAVLLFAAELAVWLIKIFTLAGGERAASESYSLIVKDNMLLFWLRIALQAAAIILLALTYYSFSGEAMNVPRFYVAFILVWLAEIAGRYLFYAAFNRIGI